MTPHSCHLLLAAAAPTVSAWGSAVGQLLLIAAIVVLNGCFVAAEFALVKVRASQLDELAADSAVPRRAARAQRARGQTENLNRFLAAAQLGITMCSLALGALAEPFIHRLIEPWLGAAGIDLAPTGVRVISWTVALLSMTALHVVVGEQIPKALALRHATAASLWLSAPLRWFERLFSPLIWLLTAASTLLLHKLFRLPPATNGDRTNAHSAEELRLLVEESGKGAEVTATEREILINALELSERIVRDIMTPRSNLVVLDVNQDFTALLAQAVESKHTRFPLIEGQLENIIGLLHIKDLLAIVREPNPNVRSIARELHAVPELMPLDKLLRFLLSKRAHLALVVDEFGATVGMVTLDDVIEEVVGTILDEFDTEEKSFQRLNDDEFLVDATLPLHELALLTDLKLESDEVSTIGGYFTEQLGRLPGLGETGQIKDYLVTVTRTKGHRLVQLQFRRQEPPQAAPAEA